MAVFHEEEQNKKLAEIHIKQEEAAVKALADGYGVSYADLAGVGINTDALLLIPEETSRAVGIAAFAMVGKKLSVAVQSPTKVETIEQVDLLEQKGFSVQIYLVSVRSLEKAWARYADVSGALHARGGLLDISDEELQKLAQIIHSNADIKTQFNAMIASGETHKISKLMEIIFGAAIATKSSDVHIEAGENAARLRFRQDGVLQDIVEFSLDIYKSINSRVKLLSELKLTDAALAQDGRFTIVYKAMEIEVRTSLIPGPYGESIVMRILNPEGLTVDLDKLGFPSKLAAILLKEIEKPNGLILTTGPTGSGKTTTLYSFLKKIYTPEIKVLTIEDPIEYHLPGITQTQVDHDHGYDFSNGLRAALRQDPDVIMVGEIRDKETASTAINAALTGHLVLSTLHTNNAAGAIPRLIELGVNPKILPDALTVAMAQRTLRRLCVNCKQSYTPGATEDALLRAIIRNAEEQGKDFSEFNFNSKSTFTLYKPVGCDVCDHMGYKGRVGLFEAIIVDDNIAEVIGKNPSERDIKKAWARQGIFTMIEDGVTKIISGLTNIDEVQGTIDMTEDLPEGWNPKAAVENESSNTDSNTKQPANTNDFIAATMPGAPLFNMNDLSFYSGSSENGSSTASSLEGEKNMPMQELMALVEYLKILEREQESHPEVGIKAKVTQLKEVIVDLLKRSPLSQWVVYDPSVVVHDEIHSIIKQLESLEEHQAKRPNVGVATQLHDIRNTIENLIMKG